MGIKEKVSIIEFEADTTLSADQIRDAGRRSMEAGRRFLNNTIVEGTGTPSSQSYIVKGGFSKQMAMAVSWQEVEGGRRRVHFEVREFTTSQQTVFLIPIMPKSAPALPSARRFAEALREELAA